MFNIYKLSIENKAIYIGCTKHSIHQRYRGHLHNAFKLKQDHPLYSLFRSGADIKLELIAQTATRADAFNLEKNLIREFKTHVDFGGTNISFGGLGNSRNVRKETVLNIKKGLKTYYSSNPGHNKGKVFSAEYREKLSKARMGRFTGKDNVTSKAVIDSLGNKFDSVTAAADFHRIKRTSVTNILTGYATKTKKGLTFIYA